MGAGSDLVTLRRGEPNTVRARFLYRAGASLLPYNITGWLVELHLRPANAVSDEQEVVFSTADGSVVLTNPLEGRAEATISLLAVNSWQWRQGIFYWRTVDTLGSPKRRGRGRVRVVQFYE
jgi:hypothetical protein